MRIGELANRTGVSTKTIRYYERLGILPEPQREANGYRSYQVATGRRLEFIKDAQAAGLTLTEINWILDLRESGESSCQHVAELLDVHVSEVDSQLAELQRTRKRLVELRDRARSMDPTHCTDPDRCQTIPVR